MTDNISESPENTPFSVIKGGRADSPKEDSPARQMPWAQREFRKNNLTVIRGGLTTEPSDAQRNENAFKKSLKDNDKQPA